VSPAALWERERGEAHLDLKHDHWMMGLTVKGRKQQCYADFRRGTASSDTRDRSNEFTGGSGASRYAFCGNMWSRARRRRKGPRGGFARRRGEEKGGKGGLVTAWHMVLWRGGGPVRLSVARRRGPPVDTLPDAVVPGGAGWHGGWARFGRVAHSWAGLGRKGERAWGGRKKNGPSLVNSAISDLIKIFN
jgi:hypothetical protein